jgi:hypothetical protein
MLTTEPRLNGFAYRSALIAVLEVPPDRLDGTQVEAPSNSVRKCLLEHVHEAGDAAAAEAP